MPTEATTISIEEIPVSNIDEFWGIHYRYLVADGIITDDEDKEYFAGEEYRGIIRKHMEREVDRHHMIYFVMGNQRIGAAQYNTYQSMESASFWIIGYLRDTVTKGWDIGALIFF